MNTLDTIIAEIGKALLPLKRAVSSLDAFKALLRDMGWSLESLPAPIQNLNTSLTQLEQSLVPVLSGEPSLNDLSALADSVRNLISGIKNLESQPFDPVLTAANFAQEFPPQLLDYLIVEYLNREHPKIGYILQTFGIIRISYREATPTRIAYLRKEILWEKIPDLLSDPVSLFAETYGWGTEQFAALLVYQKVLDLMLALKLPAHLKELDRAIAQKLENNVTMPGDPTRFSVVVPIYEAGGEAGDLSFGLKLFGLPQDGTKLPGLALIPYAKGSFEEEIQLAARLFFTLKSSLALEGGIGVKIRPDLGLEVIQGLNDPDNASSASGELKLVLINRDTHNKSIALIGSEDGSGFFYKALSLSGGFYLDAQNQTDLYLELELVEGKVLIKPGGGDGFLTKILPENGIEADLSFALGISKAAGFYFRGSSGLEINLPTHLTLGPIEFQAVIIGVSLQPGSRAVPVNVGATIKTELGPLTAIVENIGFRAEFSFPEGGGDFGPIDLDLHFKPPTGAGLSIDASVIKGGGFLRFIPEKGEYFGALELVFSDFINLKALGLINTKMPDGSSGFSLLIIITAEFTPIQLGFGFTLIGVGGLLGLNRTTRIEVLREGIKTNALKSILFPEDVVANITRIISDIKQVFPPQEGRFIIGPMAKIGWGTPSIITLELGLLLEIPVPRIAILGVLKALLPEENTALLRIQVNFLGVIDFENKYISFDASLYDSRLLIYTLTGDMAFRLSWGDNPLFILSVGGFHPSFREAPADLQNMIRLTISLLSGENPRITIQSYFAVTSNTVQFGAKAELYAAAAGFNVYGFIGYDVLFQFDPFHFIAAIYAGLALRRGTSVIMGIRLSGELAGPTPWDVRGEASISILFFEISVGFHETWGDIPDEIEPEKADLIALLTAEVNDVRNWKADIPDINNLHVSVKQIQQPADKLIVHPFGVLTFSERLVPLQVAINKFGNKVPKDANKFELTDIKSNGTDLSTQGVKEQFARANFIEMKDNEKLSIPSFEQMPSGFAIAASAALQITPPVNKSVDYELTYLRKKRFTLLLAGIYKLAKALFKTAARGSAVAKSSLSYQNNRISSNAPEAIVLKPEQYVIANISNMELHSPELVADSYTEAAELYRGLVAQKPELQGQVQILSHYELNTN